LVISAISVAVQRACKRWLQGSGLSMCILAPLLAACSALPAAGPTTADVTSQAVENGQYQFDLVDVNQQVIDTIAKQPIVSFHSRFSGSGLPAEETISVGDSIGVTIYQATDQNQPTCANGVGNLAPGNALPTIIVPEQLVMRDGTIVVPYVGRIRLVGISTAKAEAELQNRLKDQLITPQVIVSINKSDANTVTVSGEGAGGSRVQLSPRGTRLLEAIASAGGVKSPTYELFVRLTRGAVTATIPYDALVAEPAENIYAYPGDIITLTQASPTFGTFGATGKPLQYPWGADKITLAQALAMTSGLDDTRADPAGVFLMRYEPPSLVRQLIGPSGASPDSEGLVPVVFHFDLSDAGTYLLAQRFAMRDKDAIYVANAKANALQKFFNIFTGATGPVFAGAAIVGK
jgi:polysaccharide biosynthesis/export protein